MHDEGGVLSAGGSAVLPRQSSLEGLYNRLLGGVIGLGVGPKDMMLLDVVDRDSGRTHSTPIHRLRHEGRSFLVALRGRTQWVRNAEQAGSVVLRKGYEKTRYQLAVVSNEDKPAILESYLESREKDARRFFPVEHGSPAALAEVAGRHAVVFELLAPADARADPVV